jgi:hypothetical protein
VTPVVLATPVIPDRELIPDPSNVIRVCSWPPIGSFPKQLSLLRSFQLPSGNNVDCISTNTTTYTRFRDTRPRSDDTFMFPSGRHSMHLGNTNAERATNNAFRKSQSTVRIICSIHSTPDHRKTKVQIPQCVTNYQRSPVLHPGLVKHLVSIVMFAAAWLWAFRRAPPGTLKESPFLWELRFTPV